MTTFGERLRKAIAAENLLESEFAKLAGIDPTLLSHYINDTRQPAFHNLRAIVEQIRYTHIDWLITGKHNEAARYFESRPTGGEDKAHWSNVTNAENCRNAATLLEKLVAPATVKESLTEEMLGEEVGQCMQVVRDMGKAGENFGAMSPVNAFLEGWMARARR